MDALVESVAGQLRDMTPEQQDEAVAAARIDVSQKTRDRLYMIVVVAFSLVLVGAFATLAYGVFNAPATGGVSPELVLTTFTTVVGFLAGLFAPSPGSSGK
jgi:hypothetical protein